MMHLFFPWYFGWKVDLESMKPINRQMMTVHTFFIALGILLIGLLCLVAAKDLIQTNLGKTMNFGLGIFWATRFFFQHFVYSRELWKGKLFETSIHIVFSVIWAYFSVVFLCSSLGCFV